MLLWLKKIGLLSQTVRAKQENEKASIIEQIKLDIATKQTENLGSISDDEFDEILEKYGTLTIDDTELITFKNNYVIKLSDIGYEKTSDINFYSDTLNVRYKNNYLSCAENDDTIAYNMILTDKKEITVNMTSGNVILSVNGNNCYYLWFDASFVRLSQSFGTYVVNMSKFYGCKHTGSFKFEIIDDNEIKISEINKETDMYDEVTRISKNELGGNELKLGVLVQKGLINSTSYKVINEKSYWYGKEFFSIGDSITKAAVNYNYAAKVPNYLSFSNISCNQAGGRPITGENNSYVSLIRDMNVNDTADFVFIFGGHNDVQKTIGNDNDSTLETLCGSLNYICDNIKNKFPNADIVFATPIQRADENTNNGKLKDVADTIKRICEEKYGFKVIDLYNVSGITSFNATQYLEDGIHPNSEGHQLLTNAIVMQIKKWYR